MATKFLDDIGLAYFWSKIKSYIGTFIAAQDEVLTLSSGVTAGNRVTLPSGMQYRVGSNALQVSYNGTVCHIGKQFTEYGTSGSLSSQITLLLNAYSGDELGFRIQGTSDLSGTSVATSLPWASITSKPTEFTPSSHVHGNITNDGKLGTASRVVVTDGNKAIGVSSVTSTELGYLSGVTSTIQTQISNKVSKSGDTMTGDLTISGGAPNLFIRNASIVRGSEPASNINETEILGRDYNNKSTWALYHNFLTDGTHRIRLLCYKGLTTDNTYTEIGVGYDSNGNPYTNAPTPSSTTDSTTKIATTKWVRTATGNFACNASTATAFSSSKAVTLTGAVTGTASSTGGWTVSTLWRSCVVGQNTSSSSNPWYKVATRLADSASSSYNITFYVENTNTNYKHFGILRVSVSTNGSKIISSASTKFAWLVNEGFNEEDFVLVCPTTAASTVELWTRVAVGYQKRRFIVISEGYSGSTSTIWTLLNASSAGQSASITTAGTQIVSSASSLEQRVKALEDHLDALEA